MSSTHTNAAPAILQSSSHHGADSSPYLSHIDSSPLATDNNAVDRTISSGAVPKTARTSIKEDIGTLVGHSSHTPDKEEAELNGSM